VVVVAKRRARERRGTKIFLRRVIVI